MTHSLQRRLSYFDRLQEKVAQGRFKLDVQKPDFGFRKLDVLQEPPENHIKSYPCIVYHTKSNIEYVVKIIPIVRSLRKAKTSHPADIEVILLQRFNEMIKYGISPHLTFHIDHRKVPNNAAALYRFPLKNLRPYIESHSYVLTAEYVQGGCLKEWMHNTHGTLDEWRYILFAVSWTLLCVQDRYRCIHNDLHHGNILVDTRCRYDEKPLLYHLVGPDININYKIVVPGVVPKFWDWEVASTFKDGFRHMNPMRIESPHFPVEFDPHYDLHYFLTTLLECDIPDEIVDLIYELYGDECIPSERAKEMIDEKYFGSPRSSRSSRSSRSRQSTHSHSSHSPLYSKSSESSEVVSRSSCVSSADDHAYYRPGDELSEDEDEDDESDATESSEHVESEENHSELRDSSSDDVEVLVEGEVLTEYLLGERLLNGAWRKKQLPTPLSLLQHDFFACYREEASKNNRVPAMTYRHIREEHTAYRLENDKYI